MIIKGCIVIFSLIFFSLNAFAQPNGSQGEGSVVSNEDSSQQGGEKEFTPEDLMNQIDQSEGGYIDEEESANNLEKEEPYKDESYNEDPYKQEPVKRRRFLRPPPSSSSRPSESMRYRGRTTPSSRGQERSVIFQKADLQEKERIPKREKIQPPAAILKKVEQLKKEEKRRRIQPQKAPSATQFDFEKGSDPLLESNELDQDQSGFQRKSNDGFVLDENEVSEEKKNWGLVDFDYDYSVYIADKGQVKVVPYKYRRKKWGYNFGFGVFQFYPQKYISKLDGVSYQEGFSSSKQMKLNELELGFRYNSGLGGLGVYFGYGQFSFSKKIDGASETFRNMDVKISRVNLTWTLDLLFSEPYIAPYFGSGLYKIDFSENNALSNQKTTGASEWVSLMQVGLLIQLNWMDQTSSFIGYNQSSLINSFLFVEARQLGAGKAENNFASDGMDVGAGIKLEF